MVIHRTQPASVSTGEATDLVFIQDIPGYWARYRLEIVCVTYTWSSARGRGERHQNARLARTWIERRAHWLVPQSRHKVARCAGSADCMKRLVLIACVRFDRGYVRSGQQPNRDGFGKV